VKTLLDHNVPLDIATRNVILSPQAWLTFESLATGISSDNSQLPLPRSLANTNWRVSTHGLDTDDSPQKSTLVMGDFRDLVLGTRREASVEIVKADSYVGNLVFDFIGYLRADFLVRRPSSFCTVDFIIILDKSGKQRLARLRHSITNGRFWPNVAIRKCVNDTILNVLD
jgi:hypothetical protein